MSTMHVKFLRKSERDGITLSGGNYSAKINKYTRKRRIGSNEEREVSGGGKKRE